MSKRGDLGTLFADPSLNENYVEPETGEIKPIFTHKEDKGNIFVRCEICNLQAVGKYNLDTHRGGKKHQANLEKYEMSSKFLRLQIKVHIGYIILRSNIKSNRKIVPSIFGLLRKPEY